MMKRTSQAKGSNEGGFFQDENGSRFYVKFYRNVEQAYAEAIANMVYNLVGIKAPASTVETVEGKVALVSRVEAGSNLGYRFSKATAQEICKGFLVDAFLANYDFAGMVNDNILVNGSGVVRIDNGSAFMFRAQGSLKDSKVLNELDELKSFLVMGQYPQFLKVCGYKTLADLNIVPMAKRLLAIDFQTEIAKRFPNYDASAILAMINARCEKLKSIVA